MIKKSTLSQRHKFHANEINDYNFINFGKKVKRSQI